MRCYDSEKRVKSSQSKEAMRWTGYSLLEGVVGPKVDMTSSLMNFAIIPPKAQCA